MEPITFFCTHCGTEISAEPEWTGRTTECPRCNQSIVVPDSTPSVPPATIKPQTHGDNGPTDGSTMKGASLVIPVVALILGVPLFLLFLGILILADFSPAYLRPLSVGLLLTGYGTIRLLQLFGKSPF